MLVGDELRILVDRPGWTVAMRLATYVTQPAGWSGCVRPNPTGRAYQRWHIAIIDPRGRARRVLYASTIREAARVAEGHHRWLSSSDPAPASDVGASVAGPGRFRAVDRDEVAPVLQIAGAATRAAGIRPRRISVRLDRPESIASSLRRHLTPQQLFTLSRLLREEAKG